MRYWPGTTCMYEDCTATAASSGCRSFVKWLVIACLAGTLASAVWRCRDERPAACELPQRDCTEGCDDLVQLLPEIGPGYFDDYIYEESSSITSTSYLRRDLMMLVKYAAARVACEMPGQPLGMGDASDVDGNTPGTAYGRARHPRTTHERGLDIDIAYYQRAADNRLRPVCPTGEGRDAFRCVDRPNTLDVKRTALFIGTLFESERVRIVGIDGKVAVPLRAQLDRMCRRGELTAEACKRISLGYETEQTGRFWYYGHHNHMHVSLKR